MYKRIFDNMKKESTFGLLLTIFTFMFLIYILFSTLSSNSFFDNLIYVFYVFMLFLISLYSWLYAFKYVVDINNDKILLKTLFKKLEINICDVEKYTCKRYLKSVFYQFELLVKGKKILINTRFKNEFMEILSDNNIKQEIK